MESFCVFHNVMQSEREWVERMLANAATAVATMELFLSREAFKKRIKACQQVYEKAKEAETELSGIICWPSLWAMLRWAVFFHDGRADWRRWAEGMGEMHLIEGICSSSRIAAGAKCGSVFFFRGGTDGIESGLHVCGRGLKIKRKEKQKWQSRCGGWGRHFFSELAGMQRPWMFVGRTSKKRDEERWKKKKTKKKRCRLLISVERAIQKGI
ncbi:uncharacterized protein MONOS_16971 [Monocercomonoides exilis]|uniref:uncharacterized protein n=1 Tax=Monocercomonoides exilis TaxID=2049356 RepID=UPI003559D2C0|nr:hypothetical protein MONOS_16971 [Monocercomonoides exilis]